MRPTVADAFSKTRWTLEAEALFQKEFADEVAGFHGCYFCNSNHHVLTDCPEKPQ